MNTGGYRDMPAVSHLFMGCGRNGGMGKSVLRSYNPKKGYTRI